MKYQKIGPYILLQKIAAGGMADIFLAKKSGPNNLNSFYAVKKILEKYAEMPKFHKMFHEEAKITNALSLDIHKNVMTSATYEKVGSSYIFVMEYIKGLNLKHFLKLADKKNSPIGLEAALYITAEIASGLDHLHNLVNLKTGQPLNLIHRDISPQNVMISHNGQIKIIDFGIAKASILEETQADSGIKGKMAYMSPEQATGNSLDNRSDIFSLGIMLWELLAKKRLFLADSSMETLRNVRNCEVPNIKTFNPNISPEVEQILKRSLAKNKEDRYARATDFAQDLYKALQGKENFSSYNFEKLAKNIYTNDIIKNRRLLAKYINLSLDGKNSAVDITNIGVDFDKIGKEETEDLSFVKSEMPSSPVVNTLIDKFEPAHAHNQTGKNKHKKNIDFNLNTVVEHQIKSKQRNLLAAQAKLKKSALNYKISSNTHTGYTNTKTFRKKTKNSPFFGIAFSASLAIAGFFLFSSPNQQNSLIQKIVKLKNNIAKQPKNNIVNIVSPVTKNIISDYANKKINVRDAVAAATILTYFHTKPAGVEIFVDGRPVNISPNNIELPKNKIVEITLKKYKYKTEKFKINTNLLLKKRRSPASIKNNIIINSQEILITLKKLKIFNKSGTSE